jgi:hypothetical protein
MTHTKNLKPQEIGRKLQAQSFKPHAEAAGFSLRCYIA